MRSDDLARGERAVRAWEWVMELLLPVGERLPEEKLREWAEMGVGRLIEGEFIAMLWKSDLVPEELRQEVLDNLVDALKRVAGLVVPIHLHRLRGYVHAYYG